MKKLLVIALLALPFTVLTACSNCCTTKPSCANEKVARECGDK